MVSRTRITRGMAASVPPVRRTSTGLDWGESVTFRGFRRFLDRLHEGVPLSAFWRGLIIRRHFPGAGLILALPGGPLPTVRNFGSRIDVESCTFEAGVRLE